MNELFTVEELAQRINDWCEEHGVAPASGQAGQKMTVRNIRYYRTLGLLDAPASGGGQGYSEKHRLQLAAIRLLQAQGLPLNRIQELLFGRSLEDLRAIEKKGLGELDDGRVPEFNPMASESWNVVPLDEEFMLVSRRGRGISQEVREKILGALGQNGEHVAGERTRKQRGRFK